ncbi:MAG: Ppx/GppA family phosphatase [Alphaproteobacteria bacterium]|nr:Ppx/GppA family phosphatase [Alphaproteobacteria bacterium]
MVMAAHDRQMSRQDRRRNSSPSPPIYAALDLGTNNCRLLIARPSREGFRVIDSFSRIVRLGEGLSDTGDLDEDAMARTLDALKVCAEKMARRGVTVTRSVATEACRRARNGAEFLDRVRAETGIRFEIIDSDEEARLALVGCSSLLHDSHPHALVIDIGGGSTELIWLTVSDTGAPAMQDFVSLPFGVVGFAERFGGGRVSADEYDTMVSHVVDGLVPFEDRHRISIHVESGQVQMLGTSGTVTTLAGILFDLRRYNRRRVDGSYLDFDDIFGVSRRLAAMSCAERATHPCIGAERADLVVAGAAILEGICRLWPVGRLRVADRGLREGILMGLVATTRSAEH